MTVIYVSAFLDLNDTSEERSKIRSPEKCFEHFSRLASTGIRICFFVSKIYEEYAHKICELYPNVSLIQTLELEDLNTYKQTLSVEDLSLPFHRTEYKDTKNYMIMMNSKIELVKRVIDIMDVMDTMDKSTHYSWIDFSLCHVIKSDQTLEILKNPPIENIKNIVIPGCWSQELSFQNINNIYNRIHWRFCGGFFLGDKQSIIDFYECYEKYYFSFLQTHKTIVWEVNFWAWLENQNYWLPQVYLTAHDDTMLHIPL